MLFEFPTFVVQRRVNQPLADVLRGLADQTLLAPSGTLELEADGFLCMHESLRPVRPYSARQPVPTWYATGHLLTARRRVVAMVELEVSMWSDDSTCVTIRPVARHPERWRRRRLRHYFVLAHLAVDATARIVSKRAMVAAEAHRSERGRAQDPRVGSRTTARGPQ